MENITCNLDLKNNSDESISGSEQNKIINLKSIKGLISKMDIETALKERKQDVNILI